MLINISFLGGVALASIAHQASDHSIQPSGTASSEPRGSRAEETTQKRSGRSVPRVLGRDTMREYVRDRTHMEYPSWLNPPPLAFGTTQHGKLSADQWRTVGTISLPITLVRTWSSRSTRHVKMLQNFLKLVEAIETMGLLEIDTDAINRADQLMKAYLDEAKELYRWAKVQPNNHLALHLGIFLRLFGPVHSWRSFVFERFNYFLQTLNINAKFGELWCLYTCI